MNHLVSPPQQSGIVLGGDGVYRWQYTVSLFTDTFIPFTVWKVLALCTLGPILLIAIVSISDGHFADTIPLLVKFYAAILGFLTVSFAIGYYLIYAPIHGGHYYAVFEMDDKDITHRMAASSYKKEKRMATVGAIIGVLAGNATVVGANLLAGSRQQSTTSLRRIRKVLVYHRKHVLRLISSDLTRNIIYIHPQDFDFVYGYILQHCEPSVKIRNR